MTLTTIPFEAEAATAPAPPSPLLRRIANVFVAPGELARDLDREDAPWGGPLMIGIVLTVAVTVLFNLLTPLDTMLDLMRATFIEKGQAVPPDEMLTKMAKMNTVMAPIGAVILQPIMMLLMAGVMTLVFSVLMGGNAKFRQYLAITTHAFLVATLGALLVLPLMLVKKAPVSLSLALLAPNLDHSGFPYALLKGFDVFSIWMLIVVAICIAYANRRKSWIPTFAIAMTLYLAFAVGVPLAMSAALGG